MKASILILVVAVACKREAPQPIEAPPPVVTATIAAPPARASIPPKHEVPWTPPKGPLTAAEQPLPGTWVATVGDYAIRSAFMADKVMFGVPKREGDAISAIADAITNDNRIKTNCIWLELQPERTGFRRECALIEGQPSALDKTDLFTGQKSDMGTAFDWYWDDATNTVRIRFADDMIIPASDGKQLRDLRFRTWVLAFKQRSGEGIEIAESIPEHDYELPVKYIYQIFPGAYLGK